MNDRFKAANEKFCFQCGGVIPVDALHCPQCGVRQSQGGASRVGSSGSGQSQPSKTTAAFLALLLGWTGAHKYYLHRPVTGLLYLLFCWTFVPLIIGFIEGVIYFASTPERFLERHDIYAHERFRLLTVPICAFMIFFDTVMLLVAVGVIPSNAPNLREAFRAGNSAMPSSVDNASALPSIENARYSAQDFYGTWGHRLVGKTLAQSCRLISIKLLPGHSIYFAPNVPNGLRRKTSYEVDGDLLILFKSTDNSSEFAKDTYRIVDANTLDEQFEYLISVTKKPKKVNANTGRLHRCPPRN